jgi:glycosyltransferase involved in cell wall biosynthesis
VSRPTVFALPADTHPGVMWAAPLYNFSGFADEARNFITSVVGAGVPVRALSMTGESAALIESLDASVLAALRAAEGAPIEAHPILVEHLPGSYVRSTVGPCRLVARTMFESSSLPPAWVANLNAMDEIWVPSEFNVETFQRAGVTAPIFIVPGGVDTDAFRPGREPLAVPGLRGTVFLSVFEWIYRKGWDILLTAWADAFGPADDVSLLLRCSGIGDRDGSGAGVDERIDAFLSTLGRSRADTAPIVCLADAVADMPGLYATADVYVGPTRGEGWGRPFLEAMSCGLPVIATRWGGNLAFMDDDNSLLLDIYGLEDAGAGNELEVFRGQMWARPAVDHLVELLRRAASDPVATRDIGRRARADVEQRWTWKHASDTVVARLDDIVASFHRAAPPRPGDVRVRWVGHQLAHHSHSLVNREICARLVGAPGLSFELLTAESPEIDIDDPGLRPLLSRIGPVLDGRADVEVRHFWPPDWTPPSHGAWVLIQPWEYGGLPDEWVAALEGVDEVWCPSEYVRQCYISSGIPAERVRLVPNGVATDRFRPDGARYPLASAKATKFLFVGGTIHRKGIDVLLQSYLDAFTEQDDVSLVIKSTGAATFYNATNQNDLIRELAARPGTPEIELIDAALAPDDIAALYRACDVLVHPYRGEGFALPVAEAMATALPVIVTGFGACLDFCDEDNAYLVPSTLEPIEMATPSRRGYWWAEPDGAALRRLMRHVVDHPQEATAKGLLGRERIRRDFSWDAAAAIAGERLAALAHITPRRLTSPPASPADGPDASSSATVTDRDRTPA